jgi:lysophospholipase L1-like esterase
MAEPPRHQEEMVHRIVTILALAAAVVTMTLLAGAAPALASSSKPSNFPFGPSYYLALGDSLSQGVQPNAQGVSVETNQGYPDQLYGFLRLGNPRLRLVKLGCPGETTGSMISGGVCSYPQGSQLNAAVSFLKAHRGRVSLITIDIGANDLNDCIAGPPADLQTCIEGVLPTTVGNLKEIMAALRAAGGSRVRIIGMTYYVPELAAWLTGSAGQAFARLSEQLAVTFNGLLSQVYQAFGTRVADVFSAFHSSDFTHQVTLPVIGTVPLNVALICQWTWECAPPPRGPNEHANVIGYRVIALTFLFADMR